MPADDSARKQQTRGRPFQKGASGNPAGRPHGVRNKLSLMLETITDNDLIAIMAVVKKKAKKGDLVAAKIIFDRVAPPPKGRTFELDLPAIGRWNGNDTVLRANRAIIEAVATGTVSPAEGLDLTALVEAQRAAVKELRPEAMHREPTPEERAKQKKRGEAYAKVFDRFQASVLGEDP